MKKKILVTGGAGYIGSHTVVELFHSGYMPIIIDNLCNTSESNLIGINQILKTDIPFHKVDCTDLDQMKKIFETYKDIYACIHSASKPAKGSGSGRGNQDSCRNILVTFQTDKPTSIF